MTFPILPSNAASTGYNLTRSLRLRASANAYLNRTVATSGNRLTWTWSAWVKRGSLTTSGTVGLFGLISSDNVNQEYIAFNGNQLVYFLRYLNVDQSSLFTTQVFRDPSAWYHIVVAVDNTQATASNRLKMYVNGSQITAFSTATYSPLNQNTLVTGSGFNIGTAGLPPFLGTPYFDGYIAENYYVDGQALTPASFGSTNALTGVWQPARYTGTYGTNGFYLPFTDNSALTTSSNVGLGKDFSGNGNYWTTNNISITAGVTYDSMTDVPTLTSATAANFATLNPLVPAFADTSAFSMGSGNLAYQGNLGYAFSTIALSGNSFYCEYTSTTAGTAIPTAVGIWQLPLNNSTNGFQSTNYRYSGDNGQVRNQAGTTIQTYSTFDSGDIIGVAFNASNGSLFFAKNGTWLGSSNPATNTNPAVTGLTGSWVFGALSANQPSCWFNFGQRPFAYTPPTGFVALNTFNLPTATILKGNTVMDATLYTGTLVSNAITNAAGFQPDLVWIKSRSAATDHELTDSVRGVTLSLTSNSTAAEATDVQGLTAFNANGFTVGTNTTYNNLAATYVAWQWQAGQGSSSSNTNGSITSTVSVNPTAGFSVVTYTANGTTGSTFGHGLGVAPAFVILKSRSVGATDWFVYHQSLGGTKGMYLNLANAAATSSAFWNNTAPSSTVVTVGSSSSINTTGSTNVAYCFAEIAGFSKFGSYTGNGSADGTFVYTGFRPKAVIIVNSSAAENWRILDTSRNSSNVVNAELYPSLSNAEATNTVIDILSNGFKIRTTSSAYNTSGNSYIFAAWAENPFKNSLAR